VLRATSGRVVATTGAADPAEYSSATVSVLGEEWGTLCVYDTPDSSPATVRAALEHGPTAIALTLLRTGRAVPLRQRLTRELLEDLLAGRFISRRDLEVRAGMLGLTASSRQHLAGLAVGDYPPEEADVALHATEGAVAEAGGGLVAEVGTLVLGVVVAGDAQALLERVEERMRRDGGTGSLRLALGPVAGGLETVGQSLADAQSTLPLARELGTPERAVTARGMAADRLLAKLARERETASFVEDELGPLLRHDAAHGTELAKTLWTCLVSGQSKSEIARSLHLRRQSLYQRLAKIEALVGPIDDPGRRVALILALKAHRLMRH
jgi:purine catabolism regulator